MSQQFAITLEDLKSPTLAFAIGDALGAPFEFKSPLEEDLKTWFRGHEPIRFTDDTFLYLSTLAGLRHCLTNGSWKKGSEIDPSHFWIQLKLGALKYLHEWFKSGDHRGMGLTTRSALFQLHWSVTNGKNLEEFSGPTEAQGYPFKISAGNGILSRALPLVLLGFSYSSEMKAFLDLTHLHPDGHLASKDLIALIQEEKPPNKNLWADGKGFYAPETLWLAYQAGVNAKNLEHVFVSSILPEGDNDSVAALASAIAFVLGPKSTPKEIEQLANRFAEIELIVRFFAEE
ncbi:MAG: ADP-ribosylglycohydrolase family protein [Bdellovibrionales bacterium]|nr:ADP-ribosylglycohydrolase family protein [Bdellovibrionales bacterium]